MRSPGPTYDQLPYAGRPIAIAHPDRMALAAMARGLEPAPPDRCRVLEIGCAEGANLLATAFHLPDCELVGVDASAVHARRAKEARDALALHNVEILHADGAALPRELGPFDYIVVHGVFSWVDHDTRNGILETCRRLLSPRGVAYVSYNCRPGWLVRGELRRALLGCVDEEASTATKSERVREILGLASRSPFRGTPGADLLAAEAERALKLRDEHLLHEYLSPVNDAFHLREFLLLARVHGLAFVAELARTTEDPAREAALRDLLSARIEDPFEAEELVDLFLLRPFRATLLAHPEAVARALPPEAAMDALVSRGRFAAPMTPAAERPSLAPGREEKFRTARDRWIAADHPVLKAAFVELGRAWPHGLELDALCLRVEALMIARQMTGESFTIDDETRAALRDELLTLREQDHVRVRLRDPVVATEVSERPRVSGLTRYEAERGDVVTTPYHEQVKLDALEQLLSRHLDGTRTHAALVEIASAEVDKGRLEILGDDGAALDRGAAAAAMPLHVDEVLRSLLARGLLR